MRYDANKIIKTRSVIHIFLPINKNRIRKKKRNEKKQQNGEENWLKKKVLRICSDEVENG